MPAEDSVGKMEGNDGVQHARGRNISFGEQRESRKPPVPCCFNAVSLHDGEFPDVGN